MNKTIKLSNGSTAVDFTAEDSKLKAIVHLGTLRRITSHLLKDHPRNIVRNIITQLSDNENDLDKCIEIMSDEVNFHQSVRQIELYVPDTKQDKAALAGIDLGIDAANRAIKGEPEPIDML